MTEEKKLTPMQAMYGAIVEVCKLDPALVSRGRFAKFSKELLAAEYTPEMILAMYGPGSWWYENDWRGQKGDPPNQASIAQTIARANMGTYTVKVKTEGGGVHL